MRAGGFAAGSAMCEMVDVPAHDPRTQATLDGFRQRLHDGTDQSVLAAAAAVDSLVHPLADELRDIVDRELSRRDLSLALLAPTVRIKQCCGAVLEGEVCDCAELDAELAAAPVIWLGGTA